MMWPKVQVRSAAARSAAVRWSTSSCRSCHPLGVDDVLRAQHLRLLFVGVLEVEGPRGVRDVQHPLRVGHLGLALALGRDPRHPVVRAEQLGGLVQQGHVGGGPVGGGASDGGRVLLAQPGGLGEEVGHQLLRREARPQLVDSPPHLGILGQFVTDLGEVAVVQQKGAVVRVGADPGGVQVGEGVEDVPLEVLAGRVVLQQVGAGAVAGGLDQLGVQHQLLPLVLHDDRRVGRRLPGGQRLRQGVDHVHAALHGGGARGVGTGGPHPGEQLAQAGQQHPGLAQRGQHLPDVADEGRVRADDQHGTPGQQLPVLVEQVGGAVQRHRGLSGARAALDDQHPLVRGADDGVLVGLDGAHDVGHSAGARRVQRGQQHRVASGVLVAGALGVGQVEHLVVQPGQLTAPGGEVPAAAQAHRGVAGGEVEGAGDRGPPVDEERPALPRLVGLLLAQPDPPDVVLGAIDPVDPAEAERAVHRVERGQQSGALGHRDVPLHPRLGTAADRRERAPDRLLGLAAQCVDMAVEAVDEFLLGPPFPFLDVGPDFPVPGESDIPFGRTVHRV